MTSDLPGGGPVLEARGHFVVVRDDLLPGGTKARCLPIFFDQRREYVYASPVQGYAQVALAHCAAAHGKRATVFCARRKEWHPRTHEAMRAGARIEEVAVGYLNVVQRRAMDYCLKFGARLLPWGLDDPAFIDALAGVARGLSIRPHEVWTAAGSGVLTRALQQAWPMAAFHAVRVGAAPNVGRARLYLAPEAFDDPALEPPPFPSCQNYDAKVWSFIQKYASPGALFWNVAR